MGFTVQLSNDDITATITTDQDAHPDLLDEMVARCERLYLTTWLALPEPDETDT